MKANINELRLDFVVLQAHPIEYEIIIIGVTKRCNKCDEIKLLSEFNKLKQNKKDGHRSYCRVCQHKSGKEYRENNKEKESERHKEYYENNKEEIREYQKEYKKEYYENNKEQIKEYYKNNKEQINENHKEYYGNNKEQINKQQKEYRENNKDKINEKYKEWYENNKEQIKEYKKEYYENNKEQINEYFKNRKKTDPLFKLSQNIRSSLINALKNKGFTKKSSTTEILGCSFEEFQEHIGKQMSRWMNWDNQGKYNGELNYGWDLDHIIPLASAKTIEELLKLCHYTNLQPLCSYINRYVKKDRTDFYDKSNLISM